METLDTIVRHFSGLVQCQVVDKVDLEDSLGRWMAEDLRAAFAWPPFDRSSRDGFAVDHRITLAAGAGHPVLLQVGETIPAGGAAQQEVSGCRVARILTGALLPFGATAVVPFEEATIQGSAILVSQPVLPGQYVQRKGSVREAGEVVIPRATRICPQEIDLLASAGYQVVKVFRQPVASILPIGSELVEPGRALTEGKIYASNGYTIAAWTTVWGGRANRLQSVSDDVNQIVERIRPLLAKSDLIVTTGGASQGDYDFASRVMEELKATSVVRVMEKTAGGPFVGGFVGNLPILSFSGSPRAAVRSGKLLLKPLLAKMQGAQV